MILLIIVCAIVAALSEKWASQSARKQAVKNKIGDKYKQVQEDLPTPKTKGWLNPKQEWQPPKVHNPQMNANEIVFDVGGSDKVKLHIRGPNDKVFYVGRKVALRSNPMEHFQLMHIWPDSSVTLSPLEQGKEDVRAHIDDLISVMSV